MKSIRGYFTRLEWSIWLLSVTVITCACLYYRVESTMSLVASLIGVSSLMLNAKGNPIGQFLTIVFSVLYGIISYASAYYGEMITYLGMTAPMAALSMVTWMKHTAKGGRMEVQVVQLTRRDIPKCVTLTIGVTILFYFLLRALGNANLLVSTFSVTTSFLAAYLTYRRSPYYAVAYGVNDIVLIVLWVLMIPYTDAAISMVLCFSTFLLNDIYGFINWRRIYRRQNKTPI